MTATRYGGLADLLVQSARRDPDKPAVVIPGGSRVTYAELDRYSDQMRDRLWHHGVRPGDRVGFRLHKSIDSVITLFGALKAGAAYVPVDVESIASRGAFILNNCEVKAVVLEESGVSLVDELQKLGAAPLIITIPEGSNGLGLPAELDRLQLEDRADSAATQPVAADDIAYILYTSGSTGNPKGVVLSHRNALSFVDWVSDTFQHRASDVFSSHAPFHFDLSILDIFVAIKQGGTLVLIGETLGKEPLRLAEAIAAERISVWYSTPSILSLLADYGKLDRFDYSSLNTVYFAGEVFPIPRFEVLRRYWNGPRFVNLYGPTETNVCTFYEVPEDGSWKQMKTFPIGAVCVPNLARVVDENGADVPSGTEGELVIHGPNVMHGYWNLPENNARAFLIDDQRRQWYRTGDIVVEEAGAQYRYLSRRDRMVKRRGYRVELGEIEVGLLKHGDIREAAVVAIPDSESGVRIVAFVSPQAGKALSIITLKRIASQQVPPYMIPDAFVPLDALPRTSTDKTDYQTLKVRAQA